MDDATLLAGTQPQLQALYFTLQSRASAELDIDLSVDPGGYGGLRTTAQQTLLKGYEADSVASGHGAYAVAAPGHSKHELGAAFDVVITSHNESSLDAAYRKLADLGRSIGLVAGYYFKTVPSDPYHFELPGTLDVLRAQFTNLVAAAESAGRDLWRKSDAACRSRGGCLAALAGVEK